MSREAFRVSLGHLIAGGKLPKPSGITNPPPSSWKPFYGENTQGAATLAAPQSNAPGTPSPLAGALAPQEGLAPVILPEFKRANDIRADKIKLPAVIVENLLHLGCKLVLAGGSKSFKSWSLIDLGLAVATGRPWWGLNTVKGNVLYINFELLEGFFEERVLSVCSARRQELPANFTYWGLRSKCYDLAVIANVLKMRAEQMGKVDLIIVDPLYKALGDLDENSASDMASLMRLVENLSETLGAAIVFGAHFSKGNQAGKEAIDRTSGSGVFARDPDAILVMTRHEEDQCYVVESELRYLAPMPRFCLRWTFPVMDPDEGLDPSLLREAKAPGVKKERTEDGAQFTEQDILQNLPLSGLTAEAWKKTINNRYGRSGKDFFTFKGNLLSKGRVVKIGMKYHPSDYKLNQE